LSAARRFDAGGLKRLRIVWIAAQFAWRPSRLIPVQPLDLFPLSGGSRFEFIETILNVGR